MTDPRWTRRRFVMSAAVGAGALLAARPLRLLARAAPPRVLRIGWLPGPLECRSCAASRDGLTLGVEEAARTASLFGWSVELASAPSTGTSADQARALVSGDAHVLASGVADERGMGDAIAAADGLRVPLLNVAAASDALRGAGCSPWAFHVAPSAAMLADAAADWLILDRKAPRVALVAAADAASQAKADRLAARFGMRHGAAPIRIALDAEASAAIREIDAQGIDTLLLVGGDAAARFRAGVATRPVTIVDLSMDEGDADAAPLPGIAILVRPVAWHPALERFGGDQLNRRFRLRFGRGMDGAAWAGWAAAKIAAEAAMRADTFDAAGIAAYLSRPSGEFDAQKGWPLGFRPWDHQLRQPVYLAATGGADGAGANGEGRLAGEQPSGRGSNDDSRATLDLLGITRETTPCTRIHP
jgi:ABC-type branched-subunit amino acid transport system substrate-binding protein